MRAFGLVVFQRRTSYCYEFTGRSQPLEYKECLKSVCTLNAGVADRKNLMCKPTVKCVLLADRHHGLTEGIRGLLETAFDAVIMVADANSLFEGAERVQPALAVVELSLPGNGGLKVLCTLKSRCPGLKIIILSTHDEPTVVRSLLDAGANGYVLKKSIGTDLLTAVEVVLEGDTYVSPAVPLNQAPGALS